MSDIVVNGRGRVPNYYNPLLTYAARCSLLSVHHVMASNELTDTQPHRFVLAQTDSIDLCPFFYTVLGL